MTLHNALACAGALCYTRNTTTEVIAMAKDSTFAVYGDYGYTNQETLAADFHDLIDAVDWAQEYFQQHGFNGFNVIEVASFADDSEYLTFWSVSDRDYC